MRCRTSYDLLLTMMHINNLERKFTIMQQKGRSNDVTKRKKTYNFFSNRTRWYCEVWKLECACPKRYTEQRLFSAEDVHHHVWGTFLHNLEQKTKKCKFNDSTSKKQKNTNLYTCSLSGKLIESQEFFFLAKKESLFFFSKKCCF